MVKMSASTLLLSPFNQKLFHEKLDKDLAELQAKQQQATMSMMMTMMMMTMMTMPLELYNIKETFAKKDHYWYDDLWHEQFQSSKKEGVLFCLVIINELICMVETCLVEDAPQRLMIKGLQGIGKSHSIVNLIHQLLYHSNGNTLSLLSPIVHFGMM